MSSPGPPSWDTDPVLTVEHLTMRFGGLVAVSDLSFSVGRGDITALIGPNGAGMVAMMVWRPRGLISEREPSVILKERKAISGSLVKEGHG